MFCKRRHYKNPTCFGHNSMTIFRGRPSFLVHLLPFSCLFSHLSFLGLWPYALYLCVCPVYLSTTCTNLCRCTFNVTKRIALHTQSIFVTCFSLHFVKHSPYRQTFARNVTHLSGLHTAVTRMVRFGKIKHNTIYSGVCYNERC
jgi:hypothetical protein